MKHLLHKSCLNFITYKNDEIICAKCKRIIGYRYWFNGDSRIYLLNDYKKYQDEIQQWSISERLRSK